MAFLEEIKMKICVLTLGCKVNHYESEVIKDLFIKRGDLIASIDESPDVVVINTCSVTNQSDSKSRKIIRQAKRKNKESIIVVCGCSSEHHKEELFDLGIDILIGNKDKTKIPDLVDNYLKDNNKYSKFYNLLESDFEDMEINNFEGKTRAFVKIQDGCNNYCSYCIIPYVRGKLRNKDLDVAIKEIKSLVERGFKEVVLTGIHTGSYGRGTDYNIVTLIKEISKLKDLLRIRISSIEITEIDDEFLNELKTNNKICDHLHIPLQSGCDKTLKDMFRKYNIEEYKEIINKIRKVRPDINITTDVIVGFPTETEENFKETINTIKEINFSKIHVFPYSLRSKTAAAKMKNIVSDKEKKERVKTLIDLSLKLEHDYYKKFLNKEVEVLIENTNDNYSSGHTSNYINVKIEETLKPNTIYKGKINYICKENVKIIKKPRKIEVNNI